MLEIFDLDHTLLRCNSGVAFFRYLVSHKVFPKTSWLLAIRFYFGYHLKRISMEELHKQTFERFLLGRYKAEMSAHFDTFLDQFLDKALCFDVVSFHKRAQHLGHEAALFSTSPDYIVEPIGQRLGFNRIIATSYGTDREGRFSHINEVVTGKRKAFYARALIEELKINKCDVRAYSDSIEDLPLLKAVGQPMVIRPCRRLNILARRRSLPVLK